MGGRRLLSPTGVSPAPAAIAARRAFHCAPGRRAGHVAHPCDGFRAGPMEWRRSDAGTDPYAEARPLAAAIAARVPGGGGTRDTGRAGGAAARRQHLVSAA